MSYRRSKATTERIRRQIEAMRRDGGWHCEAGPSSFYRWWNRRPNVEAKGLAPERNSR